MTDRCVVLLSGGLDSATVLAIARHEGRACTCLSFDYGQRHAFELIAAGRLAAALGADDHRVVRIDLRAVGGSALTAEIGVPKGGEPGAAGVPITYVPARNLVFLSVATGLAETIGARDLFIGVNAVDYSGYPDCRPEFLSAFERAAAVGTAAGIAGAGVRIHAPLMHMSKAEIIRRGIELGVDFSLTHSCYDPDARGRACGRCESCTIRARGFAGAGVQDPTVYALPPAGARA